MKKTTIRLAVLSIGLMISSLTYALNDNTKAIQVGDYYRIKMSCLQDTNENVYLEIAKADMSKFVESLMQVYAEVVQNGASDESMVNARITRNDTILEEGKVAIEALQFEGNNCAGVMRNIQSKTYILLYTHQGEIVALSDNILGRNRLNPNEYYSNAVKKHIKPKDNYPDIMAELDEYYDSGVTMMIPGAVFISVGAICEAIGGILIAKGKTKGATACFIVGAPLITVGIPLTCVGSERMHSSEVMRSCFDLMRSK